MSARYPRSSDHSHLHADYVCGDLRLAGTLSSKAAVGSIFNGTVSSADSRQAQQVHVAAVASGHCAVVYDTQQMTRSRRLALPLWSVARDGSSALAVNMQRLEAATAGEGTRHGPSVGAIRIQRQDCT